MNDRIFPLGLALACVTCVPPAVAATEPFRYQGLCEASAAARLDDTHFAVASDESERILIYERGKAKPVSHFDLPDVSDLEGAARVGDRVFWLTSHTVNKDGLIKPKRRLLSVSRIGAGPSLTEEGKRADLSARIAKALTTDQWPLEAALNVEGLAATPEGDLLLGLRGPLRGPKEAPKAAIVRIARPGAAPAVDSVLWLDLEERGIRSLERVGTGARYLIVGGAVGNKDPALFWWDGASDSVTPGPEGVLDDLVPEALFEWSDGTLQVIGDNESGCSDEDTPKEDRWFPSREFKP